jgi:hypothetical protein
MLGRAILCTIALGMFLAGCTTRYTPTLDLEESPRTIPLTVEIHRFIESPDMKVPGRPYGVVASHVEPTILGQLAGPITDAVKDDFRNHHVVDEIETYIDHPDVILTGTIKKFYETYQPKVWAALPGAQAVAKVLQADTHTSKAEADLRIILLKPTGEVIGSYRGHGVTTDDFVPNEQHPPGARLNWAFGEAMRQVREALLHDENINALKKIDATSPSSSGGESTISKKSRTERHAEPHISTPRSLFFPVPGSPS